MAATHPLKTSSFRTNQRPQIPDAPPLPDPEPSKPPIKAHASPPFLLRPADRRRHKQHSSFFLISLAFSPRARHPSVAMEMRKIACAVLVAAAAATTALAAEAPAPGPASSSFAVTPAVGAAVGASVLSFFAFYLQ
ncbi:hypothetical protein Cni_G00690 [Canna indica]|uniref:Uncharacterized protein n=1 Tax=Canna indica TaxID=4628 RepID=A0AAQ3JLB8_9LILI|nr:hypothetical protein Cni_G00690 [Canna indica]